MTLTSRFISPLYVPSKPHTNTDEELAEACGIALADESLIAYAEWGTNAGGKPWIEGALSGDPTKRRNAAVRATHEVYGASLEQLRLTALDDRLVEELSQEDRQALRALSGFNRQDRPALARALWELGKIQRQTIRERRERLEEVRQHAREREQRMHNR